MEVSVIVPVYNAASFVAQAVESALQQPETAEVILVEDGSPDNSLEVCRQLAEKHDKVRLLRHPDGGNHGAGASRNLGMKTSSCEFTSFLDADDYYLPSRFSAAKAILVVNPDCDGVYEATGMRVESESGLQRWKEAGRSVRQLTTMSEHVRPEDLWSALISSGTYGYFQLDGLVLKKGVLQKSGYMTEGLRLHQDTEFIMRIALAARLLPGRLDEPVAMARVHDNNRISAPRSAEQKYRDRMLMWMELFGWCKRRGLGQVQQRIMDEMVMATISIGRMGDLSKGTYTRRVLRLYQLLVWFAEYPSLVIEPQLWHSMKALSRPRGAQGEGGFGT